MQNDLINTLKPLYYYTKLDISENQFVTVQLYEKRGEQFFDVVLNINGRVLLLGRFMYLDSNVRVAYKDNKILIYYNNIGKKDFTGYIKVIKVLGLYNILDDMFYSMTEEEALNLYDSEIDRSFLTDKDNYTIRSDINKRLHLSKQ